MRCDPSMLTWSMSRKITNTRARGFSSIARDSRTVFGSMRVSCGPMRADDDVLELLDLLRRAAFEDLEVRLREIGDRRVVFGRDRCRRERSSPRCGRWVAAVAARASARGAPAPATSGADAASAKPLALSPEPFMLYPPSRWRAQSTTGPSASSASIRAADLGRSARRDRSSACRRSRSACRRGC